MTSWYDTMSGIRHETDEEKQQCFCDLSAILRVLSDARERVVTFSILALWFFVFVVDCYHRSMTLIEKRNWIRLIWVRDELSLHSVDWNNDLIKVSNITLSPKCDMIEAYRELISSKPRWLPPLPSKFQITSSFNFQELIVGISLKQDDRFSNLDLNVNFEVEFPLGVKHC
jgi:hypothetical protein